MSRYFENLPVGDMNNLKKLVGHLKWRREKGIPMSSEGAFSMALLPFHDVMWTGMKENV